MIFKNVHWKYHLKSLSKQRKQIGSVWLFFFVPILEFPYRPILLTSIVIYLYRIGLHQVTSLGVVFVYVGKLVGWKNQRFLFNVYKRFFLFLSRFFLHFLTFLFFLEGFFTSMVWDRRSYKDENGLRPKIQSWSWSWSYTCGLGLGLAGVMLCCGARRHNDLEGHSKFSSTIYSFLFCAWNITTVEINSGVRLLKS